MKSILSISFAILLLASCKKTTVEQTQPTPTVVTPKIKTVSISNATTTLNTVAYEYDNAGRIAKLTYANGNSVKYSYSTNMVTTESFTAAGVSDGKTTFNLNADGLAIKYFSNAAPATVTHFTYNTAKQLLTEITENGFETTYQLYHTYNADGNKIADSIVNGQISTTKKIDYYTDKISTVENLNYGIRFYGMPVKNCPKKSSLKLSTSNYVSTDYSIPETDTLGRITKYTHTSQGVTYTYVYTYY